MIRTVFLLALFAGAASAQTSFQLSNLGPIYVATNGRDTNPGTIGAPLATLTAAQTLARASSSRKTILLRAGTWSITTTLALTSADNGETWRNADGMDTAILDGGSSSSTTGYNLITIDGGSGITISGLTLQNFISFAVGLHGGQAEPVAYWYNTTPFANGNTIENCIIQNGYAIPINGAFPGGAIWQLEMVTNTTIANNAILNQYGSGIDVADHAGSTPNYGQNYGGLTIKNNAILYTNLSQGDSGAIYLLNEWQNWGPSTISNNFIRDYQGPATTSSTGAITDFAFYLDDGTTAVTITGNVVGNTQDVVNSALGPGTNTATACFYTNGGNHVTFTANICDLGTSPQIADAIFAPANFTSLPMSNDFVTGNIFIGKWSGTQQTWGISIGPHAFPEAVGITPPTISNNLYYNYGTGSLDTTGNLSSDTSPVSAMPNLSGTTYISGSWGPPGWTMPAGTTPSYMH